MIKPSHFIFLWLTWTLTASFELSAFDATQFKRIIGKSGHYFGTSLSNAGDINKDGYEDIIIGTNQNIVYVFFGGENSFSSDIDLTSPSFSGFTITGATGDKLGGAVSCAGDVNKDGYDDIIIGAYASNSNQGVAYVIYGGSNLQDINLGSTILEPHSTGFMIKGNQTDDMLGTSVSSAGDINKDGFADIMIGAPAKNIGRGAVYVIYGKKTAEFTNFDLSSMTLEPASTGFMITGERSSDQLGASVRNASDINKDGYADIIIGAPNQNNTRGAAYVVYGGPKSTLGNINLETTPLEPATTGFSLKGNANSDTFGISVSGAGDINNDGYADIIIGARQKSFSQGSAYVIYGGPKSSLPNLDFSTTALDPHTNGFMITGNAANDQLGISVSKAGDVNGDRYGDIIVGAQGKTSDKGIAYVIYGGPKSSRENVDLSVITEPSFPTKGFAIGGEASGGFFGHSVSVAGDINGDGKPELIIGASIGSTLTNAGAAYVIYPSSKWKYYLRDI